MLNKLHEQTCALKMRLVALGLALSPPACVHQNKLKQIHNDFNEMAHHMGYTGPQKLILTAHFVYMRILGEHFIIENLTDLSRTSDKVHRYMSHYFDKSFSVR